MKKKHSWKKIILVIIIFLIAVRFATLRLPKSGIWECDDLNTILNFNDRTAKIDGRAYYVGGEYHSTSIYLSTTNETVFRGASIFMIGRIMCIKEYDTGEKYWFYRQDSSNR